MDSNVGRLTNKLMRDLLEIVPVKSAIAEQNEIKLVVSQS